MEQQNFIKYLYDNSLKLAKGVYEETINGKLIKISVDEYHNKENIIKIYCNNKKIYEIYKGFTQSRIEIYFEDYYITQHLYNNHVHDKDINFYNKNLYINEEKIGNNGMWADYNSETNELVYPINKKMEFRYDYNEEKIYLYVLTNDKKENKKIEYNTEFIEKINKLLETNNKVLNKTLNGISIDCLFDDNIKYLTDTKNLNKFKETASLFKTYSKKIDEIHEEEINFMIYSLIEKLKKDVKYARINALNYYIKNNDLRDPLILKEVYNEIKSIHKSKDNKRKLIKTRKPLKEYRDIEH